MAIATRGQSPIALAQDDYWALIQDAVDDRTISTPDQLDITWKYPSQWGQGFVRNIYLREGLVLSIADYCPCEDLVLTSADREHPLELTYILVGAELSDLMPFQAGQHTFCGSGMAPSSVQTKLANRRNVDVSIHIEPALFGQWMTGNVDQLPDPVTRLVKPSDQTFYAQISTTTATMQMAVQQILQCPFQGLTQRMYLESKV